MAVDAVNMRTSVPSLPLLALLASCASAQSPLPPQSPQPFTPGVEGRSAAETCRTTSPECQRWTELARKCAENERQRDQGFTGRLPPYCGEMESYREQVTGIPLSSSPGAYQF